MQSSRSSMIGFFPFAEKIPIAAADTPNQRSSGTAGQLICQSEVRTTGLAENIAISGGVDHDLRQHSLAALLAFKIHALDGVAIHNRTSPPRMAHHMDRVLVLQQHLVHFNFQLVWLKVYRSNQSFGQLRIGTKAIVNVLPCIDKDRILTTDLIAGGSKNSTRNAFHTGEPFLLKPTDILFVIERKARNHDDIAAGNITAHVAVAFHKDNVFTACTGCRYCGRMTSCAAADNKKITFGINRNFSLSFEYSFFFFAHIRFPFNKEGLFLAGVGQCLIDPLHRAMLSYNNYRM